MNTKSIETLSASKLRALVDARAEADRQATIACCEAGLGHVRFNDLAAIATANDLPHNRAAAEALKAWVSYREAKDELDRRYKFHGGSHPIKQSA